MLSNVRSVSPSRARPEVEFNGLGVRRDRDRGVNGASTHIHLALFSSWGSRQVPHVLNLPVRYLEGIGRGRKADLSIFSVSWAQLPLSPQWLLGIP